MVPKALKSFNGKIIVIKVLQYFPSLANRFIKSSRVIWRHQEMIKWNPRSLLKNVASIHLCFKSHTTLFKYFKATFERIFLLKNSFGKGQCQKMNQPVWIKKKNP